MTNQLWSASHQLLKLLPKRFKGMEISDEHKPKLFNTELGGISFQTGEDLDLKSLTPP